MSKQWPTTANFIAHGKVGNINIDSTVTTEGFYSVGDGGDATWQHNGITGQAPSQSPSQLGGALLNDASGDQWVLVAVRTVTPEKLGYIGDASPTDQLIVDATVRHCVASGLKASLPDNSVVLIPTAAAALQEAFDSTTSDNGVVEVRIESGHSPTSGLIINGRDYGNYRITSEDAVVTAGGVFDSWVSGSYSRFPSLECLLDSDGLVDIGIHLINTCKFIGSGNFGCVNSVKYNMQLRNSRANVEFGVFDGAGEVGIRTQQASQLKAQEASANNCGTTGFDVSRASTANLMFASATGCGFTAPDPSANNQGGLVVRRSLVAADGIDASGSTRGISIQLSATCNAPTADLSGCTLTALRASGSSTANIGSADLTGSAVGVAAGFNSRVDAGSADFTGCTESFEMFGGGVVINASGATYDQLLSLYTINSGTSIGVVVDTSKTDIRKLEGTYTETFSIPDDSVVFITPPGSGGGRGSMITLCSDAFGVSGLVWCRVTNENSGLIAGQPSLAVSTGVLTGTTGVDGFVTVSPASDGNIYIENRLGSQINITVQLMCPTNFS